MGLIQKLYEGKEIPSNAKSEKVAQVRCVLMERLVEKLQQIYVWNAVAYAAVMAGYWGGKRKENQRIKLYAMICKCDHFLGMKVVELPTGWERQGLYFGFGAMQEFAQHTGLSTTEVLYAGFLLHPPKNLNNSGEPYEILFDETFLSI